MKFSSTLEIHSALIALTQQLSDGIQTAHEIHKINYDGGVVPGHLILQAKKLIDAARAANHED